MTNGAVRRIGIIGRWYYSSIAWCGTGGRIKSGHDDVPDAVGVTALGDVTTFRTLSV
jgi:hypothetical protein